MNPNSNIYVIGCGGVGSWLVPKLAKLVPPRAIVLVDGDMLEEKNLDRQLFTEHDLGKNKAVALADRYGTACLPVFFTNGSVAATRRDIFFCCVDNDPARRAVLATADASRCPVIIGANEYTDAEAYYYRPEWRGTARDPRVFYPNILTGTADDPTAISAGCTGEAAVASPQLVTANDFASALMLHIYLYHHTELNDEAPMRTTYAEEFHPIHHRVSFAMFRTLRAGDKPLPQALPVPSPLPVAA